MIRATFFREPQNKTLNNWITIAVSQQEDCTAMSWSIAPWLPVAPDKPHTALTKEGITVQLKKGSITDEKVRIYHVNA